MSMVAEKGQMHFKLRQQMQIDKTHANWENIFINLTTYAQHQFDNPCAAFKKSAAKTDNVTPAQEVGYDLGKKS